jgi:hypothetical protein
VYSGKCPSDVELEDYFYGQLPLFKEKRVKSHLRKCSECRQLFEDIQRFQQVLNNIPLEEPPPELCSRIVEGIMTTEAYRPGAEESTYQDTEDASRGRRVFGRPAFSLGIRLAATVILVLLSTVFQWRVGTGSGVVNQSSYILSWGDLRQFFDLIQSGVLLNAFRQVFSAFRIDGFSALAILGSALPLQVLSVIVFSGIAGVVSITHVWFSRSGGKRA